LVPPPGICSELAVQLIARHKAMSVAASQPSGTFVIGADTMVIGPSGPMGKPLTAEKARWMLGELRGRRHTVITGISAIAAPDAKETLGFSRSALKMRDFSDAILETYVATGEPLDKAGGYAIQGGGSDLVEAVQGRIDNVIGLDIALALKLLAEAGYPDPLPTVSDVPLSSLRGERRPPSPTRVKQTV
jgi:septum formation protein